MGLLVAADKRNGFPAGTMQSVMQQEIGGNFDKFLTDPSAYHYEANAQGKRVAGHTGKVSTAFGPFGLLESTAADPGYGVVPLKDKSLAEQVRFAGDYLQARSKGAGSLEAGLSGYGEGGKYGKQVMARLGQGQPAVQQIAAAPVQSTMPEPAVAMVPVAQPAEAVALAPGPVMPTGPDTWAAFNEQMRQQVQVADLDYGRAQPQPVRDYQAMAQYAQPQPSRQPDFRRFSAMAGLA